MQLSLTFSVSVALAAASFVPFSQAAPTSYSSTSPDASLEFKRSELVPRDISEISYVLQHIKHRSAKNFASFQANTGTSNPLTDNTAVGDLVQSYINSNTALKRDASIVKERAVNTVQKAKVFAKVKITKQAVASLTSPATVALTQVGDAVFWTGPVAAGTPAQTAQLTIDTGSSDTFFRPGFYNPKLSVTAKNTKQPFTIEFADGSTAKGKVYKDTLTIGGLAATGQSIGAASSSTLVSESQGIAGLAFRSISAFDADPFWLTLIKQGKLKAPVFGLGISRTKSRLDLGGYNAASYSGALAWSKIDSSNGFWQITDGAKLNGQAMGSNVIIDSGTTLVVGPPAQVVELCTAAGGTAFPQAGGSSLCGWLEGTPSPNFTFTFGGKQFAMSEETKLWTKSNGWNLAPIVGSDVGYENGWLVGDSFLRNVYAAFDYGAKRVGFAPRIIAESSYSLLSPQ